MLRLSNVVVEAGAFVLRPGPFEVPAGEYLVILGPNGAGKTMLLETIAGLHAVKSGRVEFRDVPAVDRTSHAPNSSSAGDYAWTDVSAWAPERRGVGFVYQDYLLFPHLSVEGNIGFGLRSRLAAGERSERVREVATLTGVEALLRRKIAGLSGGEQQRVALARALAIRPRLLLLDEPLAALDITARRSVAQEVKGLCRRLGVTVLHVTHSLDEAMSLGDRVAVIDCGRLLQVDAPEAVLRAPACRQVAVLTGAENLLEGTISGDKVTVVGGPSFAFGRAPDLAEVRTREGSAVAVVLRAADLVLRPAGGAALGASDGIGAAAAAAREWFPARVEAVEPGAAHWAVRVGCTGGGAPQAPPGYSLAVFVMPPEVIRLGLVPGVAVEVGIDPERVVVCTS